MKDLIICLGFNPKNDGSILPILEQRLKDCIELCRKNPGSTLILSGGYTFRERDPKGEDQSLLMKKYIEDHAAILLTTTKIITENSYSSTVRELCFLKEFLDNNKAKFNTIIVASEVFVDRVKLYSEYIFENLDGVSFLASKIPDSEVSFRRLEKEKFQKGVEWLSGHKKGDYKRILEEQDAYEKKILSGEIEHPVSK